MAKLKFPFLSTTPSFVRLNKSLPASCKLYFGDLVGLAQQEGYCWAEDKDLAEMQEVSVRTIKYWNQLLEAAGFIRRETQNVSYRNEKGLLRWRKKRRIYITGGFQKKIAEGQEVAPPTGRAKDCPSLKEESLINQSIEGEMDLKKESCLTEDEHQCYQTFVKKCSQVEPELYKYIFRDFRKALAKFPPEHPLRKHSIEATRTAMLQFTEDWRKRKSQMRNPKAIFIKKVNEAYDAIELRMKVLDNK